MADEPRYADEIRIPVKITLPWSGRMAPNGQPWPQDATGRDWPSRRGKPIFPADRSPDGLAPGTGGVYAEGDGRRVTDRFAAMDAAMRDEMAQADAAVRLVSDRGPAADAAAAQPAGPAMSNQEAFDHGIASSPRADAIRIPQDAASHLTGMPLLDRFGNPVKAATGSGAQTPKAFSAGFFYQRGREDAPRYADAIAAWKRLKTAAADSTADQTDPEAASAGNAAARAMLDFSLRGSPLQKFGQASLWDVQRYNSPDVMRQYREAASIYIGVYAAAAGIPRDMIQELQDDYAWWNSKFVGQKMDETYRSLPEINVENVDIGIGLVTDHRVQ